jgi:hypothetical protein
MGKRGIVAFAFAVPWTVRSNQLIAELALERAREAGAPIFTQANVQFPPGADIEVTYVEEKPGEPPPTLRIARAAVRWALLKRLDELVIVAAGPHMWRAVRDMREAAKEIGAGWMTICPQPKIDMYAEENWFCPDSIRPWTQSKEAWRKRERILEVMPFWLYKGIAS